MGVVVGQWRVGTVGWNNAESWGIMGELWLNYGQLWGIMGQLCVCMGNYGEFWGFYRELCGFVSRFLADASVFLLPFVLVPVDMSDSDFHAFNNVLYVRLSYL